MPRRLSLFLLLAACGTANPAPPPGPAVVLDGSPRDERPAPVDAGADTRAAPDVGADTRALPDAGASVDVPSGAPTTDAPNPVAPSREIGKHAWTYRTTVEVTGGEALELLLWVPPAAKGVRGLVISSGARMGGLCGDPLIRATAAEHELGILGFRGGPFGARFQPTRGDHTLLMTGLQKLAAISGLPEVEHAPLLSHGHSVGAIFAFHAPFWAPGRFFGAILENGYTTDLPEGATGVPAGVPIVSSRGDSEQTGQPWQQGRDVMLGLRPMGALVSMLVQPGAGHFAWTAFEARLLARFIAAAAERRIPRGAYAKTGPVALNAIAQEDGWLGDATPDAAGARIAPFAAYTGDRARAFWHLDREQAELWRDAHAAELAKAPQSVSLTRFPACDRAFNPPCATNTLGDAGDLIDPGATASSGLAVKLQSYNGPFLFEGGRARVDACQMPVSAKGWIVALQDGDAKHRAAERVLLVEVKTRTAGMAQTITAPALTDREAGNAPIPLAAISSSGLPVGTAVVSGAVVASGEILTLDPFARGTSEVTLRHCQAGNAQFRTAPVATSTFRIRGR